MNEIFRANSPLGTIRYVAIAIDDHFSLDVCDTFHDKDSDGSDEEIEKCCQKISFSFELKNFHFSYGVRVIEIGKLFRGEG